MNNPFSNKLTEIQNNVDTPPEVKIIGFLFIVIIAFFYIAKTSFFNSIRKSVENNEYSYQQIAMYSLLTCIIINFFFKYIF